MITRSQEPPAWRIVVGFVAAPALAAAAYSCALPACDGISNLYQRVFMTFVMCCLFGAYPTAIVFGIPTFFLLRKRLRPTLISCALAGACVAAMPWVLLTILPSPASFIQEGRHIEIVEDHKTVWWWINLAIADAQVAAVGLLGGLAFWFALTAGRPRQQVRSV
jgi:hypothetical protein